MKNYFQKIKPKEIQDLECLRCKNSFDRAHFLFNILVNTLGSRMQLVIFGYTHTLKNDAF